MKISVLSSVIRRCITVILPPRCASCGVIVQQNATVCSSCWQELPFITTPICKKCGMPLNFTAEAAVKCYRCSCYSWPIVYGRSALLYKGTARKLILGFKHHQRTEQAALLAGFMANAAQDIKNEIDMIVPVPLHWRRLFSRRYNQAALLALALQRLWQVPCYVAALQRRYFTSSQKGLKKKQRLENVQAAFIVPEKYKKELQGKHIAIIDDVWTTGATLLACAKALREAGAAKVSFITVGRVLSHHQSA